MVRWAEEKRNMILLSLIIEFEGIYLGVEIQHYFWPKFKEERCVQGKIGGGEEGQWVSYVRSQLC